VGWLNTNGRHKRVLKLEQTVTGAPCPECGSGDHTEEPTCELLLDDDCEERGIDAPDESVYCEVCGELVFGVVEFDEDQ
jgi:hypothetical protein